MFETLPLENAMFGGIDAILKYYEPHIKGVVQRNADKSRATLNEQDLTQVCQLAIVRCWKTQQNDTGKIKNFDLLVKRAIDNAVITEVGKEFCQKRGQCKIEFFSDLAVNHSDPSKAIDFETILFQSSQNSYSSNESGLDALVRQINDHLEEPRLIRTFQHILVNYTFEDLCPQKISQNKKKKIAKELLIDEDQVGQTLEEINFILQGYRQNFFAA